jgi:hypothetical protein
VQAYYILADHIIQLIVLRVEYKLAVISIYMLYSFILKNY